MEQFCSRRCSMVSDELLTEHREGCMRKSCWNNYFLFRGSRGIQREPTEMYELVKRCNKILESTESKLHLVERFY